MAYFRSKPEDALATPVRRRPSLDFSMTGLVYCSMMMFMGLAAINSQANLLFGVFGLMIGILLISGVISRVMLNRLKIQRELPENAAVGQTATIVYQFDNQKHFWPSLAICTAEIDSAEAFTRQPQAYLLHAAPGMNVSVPVEVIPKRRGFYEFDRYQVSTSFPFGFIKRALDRRKPDSMVIYPPLAKVDPKLMMLFRSAEKSGATMRPRSGGQDEFYGVKEFRSGENPRWIYWRRSARTGVLVSKEMTQVAPPRLLLLVDSYISSRTLKSHVAVEKVIAMAASLAAHALDQGLSVGLCAWTGVWISVPLSRGKRHRRDILDILARLPLNTRHQPTQLMEASQPMLESATTPVLVTPQQFELGLGDHGRTGIVVIAAGSPQAERWFQFDSSIDFRRCMPADQQPMIEHQESEQWSASESFIR